MHFTARSFAPCPRRYLAAICGERFHSGRRGFCLTTVAGLALGLVALLVPAQTVAQNIIHTIAGGVISAGAATSVDLPGPTSVAQDANGNIYIAVPSSYVVYKGTFSNNAWTLTAFAGVGVKGFSGDGGPAISAALNGPLGVAVDNQGNVYFSDLNRVREVTTDGIIHTIAGTGPYCSPSWGVCGDGGLATAAQLDSPASLVINSAGDVYIADTGDNRIRLITKSTGIITTVAGTGKTCDGPTANCGDKGPATSAYFDVPTGLAFDAAGNMFIGDTRDQRIRCVIAVLGGCSDTSQTYAVGTILTVAGSGQICPVPTNSCGDNGPPMQAKFANPSGIWMDNTGALYVVDQLIHRVRRVPFGPNAKVSTVAGNGTRGFSGDGGLATSAQLNLPYNIMLDSANNLWITDSGNQRIRKVTSGNVDTIAGGGMGGDGGVPTGASFANPISVAWDSAGNYYIADTANNRIRKVTAGPNPTITTIAGTGNAGYGGDGGPATSALLSSPNGVAVDAAGNVFVADTNNFIIREIAAGTGIISTVAGTPEKQCIGTSGNCGDGGPANQGLLINPTSVALDPTGTTVYIADSFSNRVRRAVIGGNIYTEAGTGDRGYAGDGGLATAAGLNHPYGVAVDSAGNVYISDANSNRIRCVLHVSLGCGGSTQDVGTILTYAFNGNTGYSGDGGLAVKAKQSTPLEATMDTAGNLFVSGGAYSVVRRIDAATLTAATVAGNPQTGGFCGDNKAASKACLDNVGSAVNSSGSLLIADTANNRIRQVDMVPVISANKTRIDFPPTPVGQTSKPIALKITNVGAADQPLGTFTITGPNKGDFSTAGTNCGAQLAPDLSCSVNVTFTPQAQGTRNAFLTMTGFTQRLPLSGTGQ